MGRRILYIVLLLGGMAVFYLGYNRYGAKRAGMNGDVFSTDSAGRKKLSSEDPPPAPAPKTAAAVNAAPNGQAEQPASSPVSSVAQTQTNFSDRTLAGQASDSISPNPPNGMVFSGTGKYQLYRQGNLTWRLNTETGQSCIIFATDEEWRKPKVYRAGCRNRQID